MKNEELIVQHVAYARSIAVSFAVSTGRPMNDLESEALYGLVQMGSRYDAARFDNFKIFVTYGILKQMRRFLATQCQQPFAELTDEHLVTENFETGLRRRLRRLLYALPPRQRRIIRLRYWGEMSQAEVSKRTSSDRGWIGELEHRALAQLRKSLNRRGVFKVSDIL